MTETAWLVDAGRWFFKKYMLPAAAFAGHWQKYTRWEKEYRSLEKKLRALDWRGLEEWQFAAAVDELYRSFLDFWYIVSVPEIANWGGEKMLQELLVARLPQDKVAEGMEILAAPEQLSFFQKEEIALLDIARLPWAKRKSALQKHAQAYSWLLNSYGRTRVLGVAYFQKRLAEIARGGRAEQTRRNILKQPRLIRARKRRFLRQHHLGPKIARIAQQLTFSIWWQDHRKAYIWRYLALWDLVIASIARRRKWRIEDLLNCQQQEILALTHGRRLAREKIRQRSGWYAVRTQRGFMDEKYGRAARDLYERYGKDVMVSTRELAGTVVSAGDGRDVSGRVAVIRDPVRDAKKMRAGDVLVAGMTSPDYIVLMKKAAAIITDHGGMTSHAAVVSRELGIPCIVNTRVATQVLKTGERVRVDTAAGRVTRSK